MGAGGSDLDGSELLRPLLGWGEIVNLISTTTPDKYWQYLDYGADLKRRFRPILLDADEREKLNWLARI